jgi:hypothetical protein
MTLPDRVDHRWLATLGDTQLLAAEKQLHKLFRTHETVEKKRTGARYVLLQGPGALITSWQRWLLVNNEVKDRGLMVHHSR